MNQARSAFYADDLFLDMNAKEFLRQIRDIDRRIERETETAKRIRAHLEAGAHSARLGMPRGGKSDWTHTVDKLMTLENRINARVREMVDMKQTALDMIDSINDPRYREVLYNYYINGLTWEQVAEAMGYTDVRWVYRLHGKALIQCEDFYYHNFTTIQAE